jgi:hypothetical protein
MEKHLTSCSKRGNTLPIGRKVQTESGLRFTQLSAIEENLMSLRKALNEEIQMRHDMIGELGGLKRRNQVRMMTLCSRRKLTFLMQIEDN